MEKENTPTFVQHTKSKQQSLMSRIKQLKMEGDELLDSFSQEIKRHTALILAHAEQILPEDDEEYYPIYGEQLRRDYGKMSKVVEMLNDLEGPLHPYCAGCNREEGQHPAQKAHMGVNGCLDLDLA